VGAREPEKLLERGAPTVVGLRLGRQQRLLLDEVERERLIADVVEEDDELVA